MTFDIVITGGRIIDGTGNKQFAADVAISKGRIAAVGPNLVAQGERVIDATGCFVTPGFIDMHSHSDLQILATPLHLAKVRQGVTTDVLGQDGLSYAPVTDETLVHLRRQLKGWNDDPEGFDWNWRTVGEYLDRLDQGMSINAAYLVPHSTVRIAVMGLDNRKPTDDELEQMKELVRQGVREGAVGMSAGLTYAPGLYADDAELIALCSVLTELDGYYNPHHRNYGMHALEEYAASVEIARAAKVRLHLAHSHLGFSVNVGKEPEFRALLDRAAQTGVQVSLDAYPYRAGNSYLHAYLPSWVHEGSAETMLERIADPALRDRLRHEMEVGSDTMFDVPMDWSIIAVGNCSKPENTRWIGRSIADCAEETGKRPIDFYCDLIVDEELGASLIAHIGNEDNIRAIMTYPEHSLSSDGILLGTRPHPRGFGSFVRFLSVYARDVGVVTWEEAVRKMTSMPATVLGFFDRGLIRPGMAADIVVFDPERLEDRATFENPTEGPLGIDYVIVNGVTVIDKGEHTGALPGRALRKGRSIFDGAA